MMMIRFVIAVVLAAGRGEQHRQIRQPLGGADRDGPTAIADLPDRTTLDE